MADIFKRGGTAVITGAALGIGRAAACRFARLGLNVVLIDLAGDDLDAAAAEAIAIAGSSAVMVSATSVTDRDGLNRLASDAANRFGPATLLMCNAVTRVGGDVMTEVADWRTAFDINLFGVINTVDAFAPAMIAQGSPAAIITAGSKQGITNPPGNAAYNATKAALKSYTEQLAHHLRKRPAPQVTAHLLVPGWTTTGKREHKPGAWLPDQVIDFMIPRVQAGSFYIVCPDGEVSEDMDRDRILWAAMDITEDRPAISRWHGGYGAAFEAFKAPPRATPKPDRHS